MRVLLGWEIKPFECCFFSSANSSFFSSRNSVRRMGSWSPNVSKSLDWYILIYDGEEETVYVLVMNQALINLHC